MKSIAVWLKETSEPILHTAKNTYQKGDLFCVYDDKGDVHKYPINNIWKVVEDYGSHGRKK